MAEGELLSRAFAVHHPEEAAGILELLPAAEAAAFLGEQPAEDAAPLVGAMLPTPAADLLDRLPLQGAARLINHLPPDCAAGVLRAMAPERREAVVNRLRPGRRAAIGLLLAYPGDTVGAWADPRTLAVREDASVGRARRAVADAGTQAGCDLYVVDGSRRLAGTVALGRLLRTDPGVPVARVMVAQSPALAAATGVAEAHAAPAWRSHNALPVVDARGRLLGAVTVDALERALGARDRSAEAGGQGLLNDLAATYLQALVDLLREFWAMLVPVGAGQRRERP
jgi:magnesium transporter